MMSGDNVEFSGWSFRSLLAIRARIAARWARSSRANLAMAQSAEVLFAEDVAATIHPR